MELWQALPIEYPCIDYSDREDVQPLPFQLAEVLARDGEADERLERRVMK